MRSTLASCTLAALAALDAGLAEAMVIYKAGSTVSSGDRPRAAVDTFTEPFIDMDAGRINGKEIYLYAGPDKLAGSLGLWGAASDNNLAIIQVDDLIFEAPGSDPARTTVRTQIGMHADVQFSTSGNNGAVVLDYRLDDDVDSLWAT